MPFIFSSRQTRSPSASGSCTSRMMQSGLARAGQAQALLGRLRRQHLEPFGHEPTLQPVQEGQAVFDHQDRHGGLAR
jgi:hypothetical protein